MTDPVAGQPPSILVAGLALLFRHGLTMTGTLLAAAGYLSNDQQTQLVTLGVGLSSIVASVAWSFVEKHTKIAQIKSLQGN